MIILKQKIPLPRNQINQSKAFMRITSGHDRGRRIETPKGDATRPTTDKVRQALFNRLRSMIDAIDWNDMHVIDAFAGSGALGLEALSNGVRSVTFFEKDKRASIVIKENIKQLGYSSRTKLYPIDCLKADFENLDRADLIFLDPPYGLGLAAKLMHKIIDTGLVHKGTIFYVEMHKDKIEPIDEEKYECISSKQYGSIVSNLYKTK
ncbi:MAG: 16S rRNA (guanine(966)-N(2))-methyltransferase RsmD [Rickettsiales bacterium]|nr:16S rRNA (guanine(966)-N(2))-methyltransferase RsmD [Rickettsiales bacterium]